MKTNLQKTYKNTIKKASFIASLLAQPPSSNINFNLYRDSVYLSYLCLTFRDFNQNDKVNAIFRRLSKRADLIHQSNIEIKAKLNRQSFFLIQGNDSQASPMNLYGDIEVLNNKLNKLIPRMESIKNENENLENENSQLRKKLNNLPSLSPNPEFEKLNQEYKKKNNEYDQLDKMFQNVEKNHTVSMNKERQEIQKTELEIEALLSQINGIQARIELMNQTSKKSITQSYLNNKNNQNQGLSIVSQAQVIKPAPVTKKKIPKRPRIIFKKVNKATKPIPPKLVPKPIQEGKPDNENVSESNLNHTNEIADDDINSNNGNIEINDNENSNYGTLQTNNDSIDTENEIHDYEMSNNDNIDNETANNLIENADNETITNQDTSNNNNINNHHISSENEGNETIDNENDLNLNNDENIENEENDNKTINNYNGLNSHNDTNIDNKNDDDETINNDYSLNHDNKGGHNETVDDENTDDKPNGNDSKEDREKKSTLNNGIPQTNNQGILKSTSDPNHRNEHNKVIDEVYPICYDDTTLKNHNSTNEVIDEHNLDPDYAIYLHQKKSIPRNIENIKEKEIPNYNNNNTETKSTNVLNEKEDNTKNNVNSIANQLIGQKSKENDGASDKIENRIKNKDEVFEKGNGPDVNDKFIADNSEQNKNSGTSNQIRSKTSKSLLSLIDHLIVSLPKTLNVTHEQVGHGVVHITIEDREPDSEDFKEDINEDKQFQANNETINQANEDHFHCHFSDEDSSSYGSSNSKSIEEDQHKESIEVPKNNSEEFDNVDSQPMNEIEPNGMTIDSQAQNKSNGDNEPESQIEKDKINSPDNNDESNAEEENHSPAKVDTQNCEILDKQIEKQEKPEVDLKKQEIGVNKESIQQNRNAETSETSEAKNNISHNENIHDNKETEENKETDNKDENQVYIHQTKKCEIDNTEITDSYNVSNKEENESDSTSSSDDETTPDDSQQTTNSVKQFTNNILQTLIGPNKEIKTESESDSNPSESDDDSENNKDGEQSLPIHEPMNSSLFANRSPRFKTDT